MGGGFGHELTHHITRSWPVTAYLHNCAQHAVVWTSLSRALSKPWKRCIMHTAIRFGCGVPSASMHACIKYTRVNTIYYEVNKFFPGSRQSVHPHSSEGTHINLHQLRERVPGDCVWETRRLLNPIRLESGSPSSSSLECRLDPRSLVRCLLVGRPVVDQVAGSAKCAQRSGSQLGRPSAGLSPSPELVRDAGSSSMSCCHTYPTSIYEPCQMTASIARPDPVLCAAYKRRSVR